MTQDTIQCLIKGFKDKKQTAYDVQSLLTKRETLENKGGSPEEIASLDREIDALGGEEALETDKDWEELIRTLCAHNPQAAQTWKKLKSKRVALEQEKVLTIKMVKFVAVLQQELHLAAKPRKGSLISLIFGRHPTVRRAHHIATATQVAKRVVATLSQLEETPLYTEAIDFCKRFIKESEKAFNKELYGKKIERLTYEFDAIFDKAEMAKKNVHKKIQALDKAVDAWIENGVFKL